MDRKPMRSDIIALPGSGAKYVVEKVAPDDDYYWVWARYLKILKKKDTEMWLYEPDCTLIRFPTGKDSINLADSLYISFQHIELHGQMKMIFVK